MTELFIKHFVSEVRKLFPGLKSDKLSDAVQWLVMFGSPSDWRKAFVVGNRQPAHFWSLLYNAYIRSTAWKRKRQERIEAAKAVCENCGGKAVQVHHVSYDRIGDEDDGDLKALCVECHDKIHAKPQGRKQA